MIVSNHQAAGLQGEAMFDNTRCIEDDARALTEFEEAVADLLAAVGEIQGQKAFARRIAQTQDNVVPKSRRQARQWSNSRWGQGRCQRPYVDGLQDACAEAPTIGARRLEFQRAVPQIRMMSSSHDGARIITA